MKTQKWWIRLMAGVCTLAVLNAENAENKIRNPGFEEKQLSPWRLNNWWKLSRTEKDGSVRVLRNKAEIKLLKSSACSGRQCLRLSVTEFLEGNINLLQMVKIASGESLQLSFSLRGEANMAPLKIQLRQMKAPYRKYFTAEVEATPEWKRFSFNFTLPQNVTGEIALLFQVRETGSFDLDDVVLKALPAAEEGEIPAGNRLPNGSFESGLERWYFEVRERLARNRSIADLNRFHPRSEVLDNAPDGKRVLTFSSTPNLNITAASAFFPLKYGHPATISLRCRTTAPKGTPLQVSLVSGEFPNQIAETKRFRMEEKNTWLTKSFTVIPKPSGNGRYTLALNCSGRGEWFFDDLRVQQKEQKSSIPVLGWESAVPEQKMNFFSPDQNLAFRLLLSSASPGIHDFNVTVYDAWENRTSWNALQITVDAKGSGNTLLTIPPLHRYGAFKAVVQHKRNPAIYTEIIFAIPHPVTPLKEARDFYFGAHSKLADYNLDFAEKIGIRHLRLHDSNMDTKWVFCEPEAGKWNLQTDAVRNAGERGFQIMGSFCTVPSFYARISPGGRHTWFSAYPPRDESAWSAYETYVRKVFDAFSPWVQTWEIGNESDGRFLQVPQGMAREKIYMNYLRHTKCALKDRTRAYLIGGVITGGPRPFMENMLSMGMGSLVDAISFHYYSGNSIEDFKRRNVEINRWRAFRNEKNQEMPIHLTEANSARTYTWLRASGLSFTETPDFHQQWVSAGQMVQMMAYFKALGVKSCFLYAISGQEGGSLIYRTQCSLLVDKNGLPMPGAAAHAAAVHFLEDTEPCGVSCREFPEKGFAVSAVFKREPWRISVLWANRRMVRSLPENPHRKVFDMMGNPLSDTRNVQLSDAPIYLLEPIAK